MTDIDYLACESHRLLPWYTNLARWLTRSRCKAWVESRRLLWVSGWGVTGRGRVCPTCWRVVKHKIRSRP